MNRFQKFVLVPINLLLLVAVLAAWHQSTQPPPLPPLPEPKLETLTNPDGVAVYRLDGRKNGQAEDRIDNCKIIGPGRPPMGDDLKQLIAVLTPYVQRASYTTGRDGKGCMPPIPGVGFRFRRGADVLEVLVCYHCDDLLVARGEDSSWRDFDPQHAAMVKIAKGCFPNDREIQKLRND